MGKVKGRESLRNLCPQLLCCLRCGDPSHVECYFDLTRSSVYYPHRGVCRFSVLDELFTANPFWIRCGVNVVRRFNIVIEGNRGDFGKPLGTSEASVLARLQYEAFAIAELLRILSIAF